MNMIEVFVRSWANTHSLTPVSNLHLNVAPIGVALLFNDALRFLLFGPSALLSIPIDFAFVLIFAKAIDVLLGCCL